MKQNGRGNIDLNAAVKQGNQNVVSNIKKNNKMKDDFRTTERVTQK